ncbi:MAG: RNase H family protein [Bdellovibrionota bacterium]
MKNSSDSPSADFVLYSDGGSDGGRCAAGACIVEDCHTGKRWHLGVSLGTGTNNEAEISSSLLGFAFMLTLGATGKKRAVRWVADSEYVLKSATGYISNWQRNGWKTADKKPVKNQGLWRSYLLLSEHFTIRSEHVRGHTGHVENEACDEAVQWVKLRGQDLFGARAVVETAEIHTTAGTHQWAIVDGSRWMDAVRTEHPDEATMLWFVTALQNVHQTLEGASTPLRAAENTEQVLLAPAVRKLKEAYQAAEKAAAKSDRARTLAKDLRSLLVDYE